MMAGCWDEFIKMYRDRDIFTDEDRELIKQYFNNCIEGKDDLGNLLVDDKDDEDFRNYFASLNDEQAE